MKKSTKTISKPQSLEEMTRDELDAKFRHSYQQVLKHEGRPAKDVFDDLERRYNGQRTV